MYKASSWDLVDAIKNNAVTIDKVNKKQLPKEFQNKTGNELEIIVKEKQKEREEIQKNIVDLSKKRTIFV